MSKEAENKRNTPPHSGFAMFFYRIFFAMFGAFKNEINEQASTIEELRSKGAPRTVQAGR